MTKKRARKNHNFSQSYWMYGTHACHAALENSARDVRKILCTRNVHPDVSGMIEVMKQDSTRDAPLPVVEIREPYEIEKMLFKGAVHQGIACEVAPLEGVHIEDAINLEKPILMLDQVTDPQNVGAMLRSAAAFDIGAVIMPKDNSAKESAVMAKTACGGLDIVPLVTVTNLAQAIELCKKAGYWVAGLDGHTEKTISDVPLDKKTLLILGAEGKGLRHKTRESCDYLLKLPMCDQMESLNVSNAAAIAMYELYK